MTTESRTGCGRRLGVWALRLAVPLALLALVELGYRALLLLQERPYDAQAVERLVRRIQSRVAGGEFDRTGDEPQAGEDAAEGGGLETFERVLHPYFGWETGGYLERTDRYHQLAVAQLRETPSDEAPRAKAPRGQVADPEADELRVLILGGSVANRFGQLESGGADTLARALEADPALEGKRVHVMGFGHSAFKQPQQTLLFVYLLSLGILADAVVNLDGFNEAAIGYENATREAHPALPSIGRWGALNKDGALHPAVRKELRRTWGLGDRIELLAQRILDWGLHRSSVTGVFALRRLQALEREWVQANQAYNEALRRAPDPVRSALALEGHEELVPAMIARVWSEGSAALHGICTERKIPYVHVLQPTLHDEGSKPLTEGERADGAVLPAWREGVRRVYPLLRTEGEALRARGVRFLDATGIYSEVRERVYVDFTHLNEEGNRLLAERIAQALLAGLGR